MNTQNKTLSFTHEPGDMIRLNNWIFNNILPYIKGRTFEIGSEKGGISSLFVARDMPIHLTDESDINRESLRKRFEGMSAIKMIHEIAFAHPKFEHVYANTAGVMSTIVAVNIVEHGVYDRKMLHKANFFLRIGGHFIIAMASKAVSFNKDNSDLDGLEAYNYKVARNLMGDTFEVLKVLYFYWSLNTQDSNIDYPGLYYIAVYRKK